MAESQSIDIEAEIPLADAEQIRAYRRLKSNRSNPIHGLTGTRIHGVWASMMNRCYMKSHHAYGGYGGRGIFVCERWHSIENFFADMGHAPKGSSIDRIDNDGPYSPENCRWATRAEQAKNRRNNRMITIEGRTQCLRDWCREYGRHFATARQRMLRGWTPEEALATEPSPHNRALRKCTRDRK